MRQKVLLIIFLGSAVVLKAQRFAGYMYSDYAGILGAKAQPASLAASPYKYDVNILNGNAYLANNFAYRERDTEVRGLIRFLDSKQKFVQTNLSLGGLSVMLSLPRKQGIGLNFSIRAHGSGNDMSPDFIQQINRFSQPQFLGRSFSDQQLDFALSAWYEIAFTYAAVIKDDGFNKWKLGVTPKAINSLGSIFVQLNDLDYSLDPTRGQQQVESLDVVMGYSSNLDRFEQFDGTDNLSLPNGVGFRPALDFGVTFERRAFRQDPSVESGTRLDPEITYEFKVSASITDIGVMKFNYGSASFDAPSLLPNLGFININQKLGSPDSFQQFRDSLATVSNVQAQTGTYTVSLPTALNLNYDYNIGNYYYINANAVVDLTKLMPADHRLNYLSNITITPRWEKGLKGFYMPIHFNQIGDFHIGLAARLGALSLGTQNINSLFSPEPTAGSFFFSLNISELKANSKKPYCFGTGGGSGITNKVRTPLYKRKKWIFF